MSTALEPLAVANMTALTRDMALKFRHPMSCRIAERTPVLPGVSVELALGGGRGSFVERADVEACGRRISASKRVPDLAQWL